MEKPRVGAAFPFLAQNSVRTFGLGARPRAAVASAKVVKHERDQQPILPHSGSVQNDGRSIKKPESLQVLCWRDVEGRGGLETRRLPATHPASGCKVACWFYLDRTAGGNRYHCYSRSPAPLLSISRS